MLNGEPLGKFDPPGGGGAVRVALKQGANPLVCRAASAGGPWKIALQYHPLTPGAVVRQVSAAELGKVDALHPRKPAAKK